MKKFFSFFASRMFIFFALIALQAWFFVMLVYTFESLSTVLQTVLFIASILLVLWIVNKNNNPGYKIAWIILILIMPVLGITMYFFLSQRKLSSRERNYVLDLLQKTGCLLPADEKIVQDIEKRSLSAARQAEYIYNTSTYPLYGNTSTKYYPTGEAFWADLLVELEKAEKYIFMEYFIIEEGRMWKSILDILERKAADGVDVRFMYDDIGCIRKLPPHYEKTLRAKGIKCVVFNTLKPVLNSMFNNRDHRKITIIDGHTGFCGGANLADEYINEVERFGRWKDASVMLKGDAVWSLLMMFLQLWHFTAKEDIDLSCYMYKKPAIKINGSNGFVQPFADAPIDDINVSESVYINMISRAKNYVYINTPYLILGNELITVLATAASSGVDVRITVPHIPDKKGVFMVTQSYYAPLIKAGVKIYEYTPGFIHSKTFVCDDNYAVVGTINLDYRSLYLNFECGVWMYGTDSIIDMKRDYLETAGISREITYADTQNIPWYKSLAQGILRIFGPLM